MSVQATILVNGLELLERRRLWPECACGEYWPRRAVLDRGREYDDGYAPPSRVAPQICDQVPTVEDWHSKVDEEETWRVVGALGEELERGEPILGLPCLMPHRGEGDAHDFTDVPFIIHD